jgi:uncharacterized protein (TIGR00251 family)
MSAAWQEWQGETLLLNVRVQPRASRDEVVGVQGGCLKIRIAAPPVGGAANAHLVRFLAAQFGIPRSRVQIVAGPAAREKRIAIHGPRSHPAWLQDSV